MPTVGATWDRRVGLVPRSMWEAKSRVFRFVYFCFVISPAKFVIKLAEASALKVNGEERHRIANEMTVSFCRKSIHPGRTPSRKVAREIVVSLPTIYSLQCRVKKFFFLYPALLISP